MPRSLVLISGFGPFESVRENPSGEIAKALANDPPEGIEVIACRLPVSFVRGPHALDRALEGLQPRVPDLLLGLGVHPEAGFRFERVARGLLTDGGRTDVDGRTAVEANPSSVSELTTILDLSRLLARVAGSGSRDVCQSADAGGYVCERVYHHILARARDLRRPGLFLHVPPAACTPLSDAVDIVGRLLPMILESRPGVDGRSLEG